MVRAPIVAAVAAILGATLLSGAEGSRIVTMPTARLLSAGSICTSYFWADLDTSSPYAPQSMSLGILGLGLTPNLEVDLTYLKPEGASSMTSLGVEYLVSRETLRQPAVALGAEDVMREIDDTSFYLVLSKILTARRGQRPTYPAIGLTLGYTTKPGGDMFGGAQARLSPEVSVCAGWDGYESIYSLSYRVPNSTLVLMAGTLGDARWVGARYTARFRKRDERQAAHASPPSADSDRS